MNQQTMIDDLIRLLDEGAECGVGHINVACGAQEEERQIRTGCPDCSINPLACSVPTLHQGLDQGDE